MAFTRDLVANYSAPTDGQHAVIGITTMVAGETTITFATPTFSGGDVNKIIHIRDAGGGGANDHITYIKAVTSSTVIQVPFGHPFTMSGTTKDVWWGTNCNTSLVAFRNDARAEAAGAGGLCTLTIPSGFYAWGSNNGDATTGFDDFNEVAWTAAPLIKVIGTGGTKPVFFGNIQFGDYHSFPGGEFAIHGKIADAFVGDTTIRLLNLADVPIFTIGRTDAYHTGDPYVFDGRILVCALDIMGSGAPPNPYYFDYVRMTSINSGTGVITLASPLTDGPYLSTYPEWDGTDPIPIGRATAVAFNKWWDSDQTFENLHFEFPATGTGNGALKITMKDCTFGAGHFPNCSVCHTMILDNVQFAGTEADKIVHTFTLRNGCSGHLFFQSASIKNVFVENCGSGIDLISGTPQNITITNCTVASMGIGAQYGQTKTITAMNSVIGTTSLATTGSLSNTLTGGWSMPSPGVMTAPGTVGGLQWGYVGNTMIWQRTYNYQGTFHTIAPPTQSGGMNTPQTEYTDSPFTAFPPPIDDPGAGGFLMMGSPCQRTFFTNCTGHKTIVQASKAGGYGKPLYSYAFYDYTNASGPPFETYEVWGRVVAIRFEVITPYVGAANGKVHLCGAGNYPTYTPAGVKNIYDPIFDIKAAGLRVITPAGITAGSGLGLDAGLVLPSPDSMFSGALAPFAEDSAIGGGTFHFTFEITTDQQTTSSGVALLRLGLHL